MKLEDRYGVTLDFLEPESKYDRIIVSLCKKGQKPERIGSIGRTYDAYTEITTFQAYTEDNQLLGKATADWQEIERYLFKHAYQRSRNPVEQALILMNERLKELNAIRKEKSKALEREI